MPPVIPLSTNQTISSSSAITIYTSLLNMASNILASSGTLNASSAASYSNQLVGASSAVLVLVSQCQHGIKISQ